MLGENVLESRSRQRLAPGADEEFRHRCGASDGDPRTHSRRGCLPQGETPLPSPFAEDEHARVRLKGQIVDAQADQFGDTQRGRVAQVQHRAVADARPHGRVRRVQDRLDLIDGQMPDEPRIGLLGGDRQDLPNPFDRGRHPIFQVVHERLDGGEAGVARTRSVPSGCFQGVQEVDDQRRINLLQRQPGWGDLESFTRVGEEELEGVRVRVAGLLTSSAFQEEVLLEEGGDVGSDRGHDWPPITVRSVSSAISRSRSGTASRYQ
jgi:hypothetical protein